MTPSAPRRKDSILRVETTLREPVTLTAQAPRRIMVAGTLHPALRDALHSYAALRSDEVATTT